MLFKFILSVWTVAAIVAHYQVSAIPGDFKDAAENVDVPPEHRAAPPQPPQQHPVQPPYQPRALFPAGAVPAGAVPPGAPQYPLFFTTQNGFVPFGSIYSSYPQPQAAALVPSPAYFLPQDQAIASPIVAATL